MRYLLLLLIGLCFESVLGQQAPLVQSKMLFDKGDLGGAKAILTGIAEPSAYAEAQYYLGRIATLEKQYSRAVEYFENAVKADASSAEFHNWLGVLYGVIAMDANPIRQAWLAPKIRDEFEKAARIDPNNLQTQWGLVYYYSKAPGFLGGSWSKALQCAQVIEKINPAQGLSARGFICETQGNKALARNFYEHARQLEPGFKETEDGLKRLTDNNLRTRNKN